MVQCFLFTTKYSVLCFLVLAQQADTTWRMGDAQGAVGVLPKHIWEEDYFRVPPPPNLIQPA